MEVKNTCRAGPVGGRVLGRSLEGRGSPVALTFSPQQISHTPAHTALAAAVWANQSGPPVQAVLLGSLSSENSQTLPERYLPDAQKKLSSLSLSTRDTEWCIRTTTKD